LQNPRIPITRHPTSIAEFTIRHARPGDSSLVLEFIRHLADYEKLTHEVEATEADLDHLLFGERPYAEVIFGDWEDRPVGFALFFHNVSTFVGRPGLYLEDIFVHPDARGRSFGKAMMAHLARLAEQRRCGRFEWAVLDWNTPSIGFYKGLGARPMDEWTVFRLTGESLSDLATSLHPDPAAD